MDEIGVDHYKTLVSVLAAIREGETTVKDEFPVAPAKPEFGEPPSRESFTHLKQEVAKTPEPRPPGRPRKAQAPQQPEMALEKSAPEKSPPSKESKPVAKPTAPPRVPSEQQQQEEQEPVSLAGQVEHRLGSDQVRINAFWDAVYYWALASADITEIKDIAQENLQSLIDNWDSVEAALKHPAK